MDRQKKSYKIILPIVLMATFVLLITVLLAKRIYLSNLSIEKSIEELIKEKHSSDKLLDEEKEIKVFYQKLIKNKELIDKDILKYIESLVLKTDMKLVDLRKSSQEDERFEYYNLRLEGKLEQFLMFEYLLYDAGALLSVGSYNIEKKDETVLDIKVVLENYVL